MEAMIYLIAYFITLGHAFNPLSLKFNNGIKEPIGYFFMVFYLILQVVKSSKIGPK